MNPLKTMTTSAAILAGALFATPASAELVGGIGYYLANVQVNSPDLDYRLGLLGATLGYRYASSSLFSLTPEIRAGVGIEDDSDRGVKLEIERFYSANLRAQWNLAGNTWFYVAPSYMNIQAKARGFGVSISDDDWEFGAGLGFGFGLSDNVGLEFSYEKFDELELLGFGLRGRF